MSTVLLLPPLKHASLCLSLLFSATFISLAAIPHEFLITGDFNLHLDHPDNSQVKQLLAAFDSTNLTQHVSFPTHCDHHILDLVITPTSSSLNPVIDHSPISPSDHLPIFSSHSISSSIPPSLTQISFRCFKSMSVSNFTRDILHSRLITHPPSNLSDLVDACTQFHSNFSYTYSSQNQNFPSETNQQVVYSCPLCPQRSQWLPEKPLASHSLTSSP